MGRKVARRAYIIQCLKRSKGKGMVWWKDNQAGYTDDPNSAGIYYSWNLNDCAGTKGDWVAHPVWIQVEV